MRLLIAEDDCVSRRILESMLRKWGHEVVIACDGNDAWRCLQDPNAPKLVVLDWMMPGLDGVEVCRKVRQLQCDIRPHIILLTGKQDVQDLVKGISAGADDYVTKPFKPEELKMRILAGERVLSLQLESLAAKEALRHQATHDTLTGLRNRASIMEMLHRELARALRTKMPLSVLLADIDHFKTINDTLGHQAGDAVLIEVAQRMAKGMRSYEDLGRYGGEEFLIILTNCDGRGACTLAERMRQTVAATECDTQGKKMPVTISVGVVSTAGLANPTAELLLQLADAAMYEAKRAGRNRTHLAASSLDDVFPMPPQIQVA